MKKLIIFSFFFLAVGLVAFVSVGEAFFSRYFLQKMVDDVGSHRI